MATTYVYQCTNGGCRHQKRQGGMKKSSLGKCPECGKGTMQHIRTEK